VGRYIKKKINQFKLKQRFTTRASKSNNAEIVAYNSPPWRGKEWVKTQLNLLPLHSINHY
jgi:hypothetical protein